MKLKENFAENFGEVFGYGEMNLKLGERDLNYVWVPINTFIDKYLYGPEYKYTRILAIDNLTGIRIYFDNKYKSYSVFTTKDISSCYAREINAFKLISNVLNASDITDKKEFLEILRYFETLYYSGSCSEFSNLSCFIDDITDDFKEQMLDKIEDLYTELKELLFEEE